MSSEARTVRWTISKAELSTIPIQSDVQYTNGSSAVEVSLDNFDSTKMILGGTSSAIDVGTYICTVTPKANYCWSDGTSDAIEVAWTLTNAYKIMTVMIDESNSNPLTSVTYADDAATMTAGSDEWDEWFGYYPVLFKDGAEVVKLNPNDYSKDINGNSIDITSGDAGDVMVAFPRMGLKMSKSGDVVTISMTDNPNDANFKYYAHQRGNTEKDVFYIGAFKGYSASSKLRSLSGKTPTGNQNISAFRTLAQANGKSDGNGGSGYEIGGFFQLTFRQCMYVLKYKNLNSQEAVGMGYVKSSHTAATKTGNTDAKGLNFGSTDDNLQCKLFGVEDMWGNIHEWIDGLVTNSSRQALTATDGFNDAGTNYTNQGATASSNLSSYPWRSKICGTTEKGFISTAKSGSATTYYCDLGDVVASRVAGFGGHWNHASYAGVFYLNLYDSASDANSTIGARLMYL